MGLGPKDEETFRRYLCGDLSGDERETLLRRVAEDEELFASLEECETEWIDRFARGELGEEEAGQVKRYLRETGQEHRVSFAAALAEAAERERAGQSAGPLLVAGSRRPGRPRWLPAVAIAASLAALLVSVALYRGYLQAPPDPEAPSDTAQSAATPSGPLTITIPAGIARGPEPVPETVVSPESTVIRLRLEIPEGRTFPTYRAALLGAGDREEWQHVGPAENAPEVVLQFEIPRDRLGEGSREFSLYGRSPDGTEELLGYYTLRLTEVPAPGP